jgi:retron-type reverse transcriptase
MHRSPSPLFDSSRLLGRLWRMGRRFAQELRATAMLPDGAETGWESSARERAVDILKEARVEVEELAGLYGLTKADVIRNGFSASRGPHLVLWSSLIEWGAEAGWLTEDDDLPGIDVLESWPIAGGRAVSAILHGRVPSPAARVEMLFDEPIRLIETVQSDPSMAGQLSNDDFVTTVNRARSHDVIQELLGWAATATPPGLSAKSFNRLHVDIQRVVLDSAKIRHWVLDARARARFDSDPGAYRQSRQARRRRLTKHVNAVLDRVRGRDFAGISEDDIVVARAAPRWAQRLESAVLRPRGPFNYSCPQVGVSTALPRALQAPAADVLRCLVGAQVPQQGVLPLLRDRELAAVLCSGPAEQAGPLLRAIADDRLAGVTLEIFRQSPESVLPLCAEKRGARFRRATRDAVTARARLARTLIGDDMFESGAYRHGASLVSVLGAGRILMSLDPGAASRLWSERPRIAREPIQNLFTATIKAAKGPQRVRVVNLALKVDPAGALCAAILEARPSREALRLLSAWPVAWKLVCLNTGPLSKLASRILAREVSNPVFADALVALPPARLRGLYRSRPTELRKQLVRAFPAAIAAMLHPVADRDELLSLSMMDPRYGLRLESGSTPEKDAALARRVRRTMKTGDGASSAFELAALVGASQTRTLGTLSRLAWTNRDAKPGTAFDGLYHTYKLPKRRGGTRTITVPDLRLRHLQRRIADRLLGEVPLHSAAHGFRAKHSIVSNATPHVGNAMVVNLDVRNFFPSTSRDLVWKALRRSVPAGMSDGAFNLLVDVCCYDGALPIGAPSSPVLANIVLSPVDAALSKAATRFDLQYTRYADDLTFSGHDDAKRIIPFVAKVLGDYGFVIEPKKINIFRRGRRQIVTGLVVNERVNVARYVRRRLRAAVHRRCQGQAPSWHGRDMGDAELLGRIAALGAVRPEEAAELRAQVREVIGG